MDDASMKKCPVSFVLTFLLLMSILSLSAQKVGAVENLIFQDDFESYDVGTFPYSGGWEIVYNGAGNQYQVISNAHSVSGTKSLQLMGKYSWSVVVEKDFSSSSNKIGWEASVMSTDQSGGAYFGFHNRTADYWGRSYCIVALHEGYIISGASQNLQPFTPNVWYRIKAVIDKTTRLYDVWIDGQLAATNLLEDDDPNEINAFQLSVEWHEIFHYYDDVKVFALSDQPPTPVGNFQILDVQPIQAVFDESIELVAYKATAFRIRVKSTFPTSLSADVAISTDRKSTKASYTILGNREYDLFTLSDLSNLFTPTTSPFQGTVIINPPSSSRIPETTYDDNSKPFTSTVVQTSRMKCQYRALAFDKDTNIPTVDDLKSMQKGSDALMRAMYPISEGKYSSVIQIDPYVMASSGNEGLDSLKFTGALVRLQGEARLAGIDKVILVVPDYGDSTNWFTKWGLTSEPILGYHHRLLNYVVVVVDNFWDAVPHEIGHCYGVSDDAGQDSGLFCWVSPRVRNPSGSGGEYGGTTTEGFGLTGKVCALSGSSGGYRERWDLYWICDKCYEKLLDKMKTGMDPEAVLVAGIGFLNGTVSLLPWHRLTEATLDVDLGSVGNYTLRYLDFLGSVIAQTGFNVSFSEGDNVKNVSGFCFTAPYIAGAVQMQIVGNGTVVANRTMTEHSPAVGLIYPIGGESLEAGTQVSILWDGSDLDEDTLFYTVLFSYDDGGSWWPISSDMSETTLNWTVLGEHATSKYKIKVIATDGFNTGSAICAEPFSVTCHDIAVDDFAITEEMIGQGDNVTLEGCVANRGNYTETVFGEILANDTVLHSWNIGLGPGCNTTVAFDWNTTGLSLGNYTLVFRAETVVGETDISDNCFAESVCILSQDLLHDIGIAYLALNKHVVGQSQTLNVSCTLSNPRFDDESSILSIYADSTALLSTEVLMTGRSTINLVLTINVNALAKANYSIVAMLWPVFGETELQDNLLPGGSVVVTIPGDVDGDFQVTILDVVKITGVYASKLGDPSFSPNSDINDDGTITILDVVICTGHYGEKYP